MRTPLADRIYRALLVAYPADVRQQAGDDLLRHFQDEREACRRGGFAAACWFWPRTVADALHSGLLERLGVSFAVSLMSPGAVMTTASDSPQPIRRRLFDGGGRDVLIGLRRLRATPGFTLVAALTLALGSGATSAIFSVVEGVLLKPLAFADSTRVVGLFHVWKGRRDVFSPPNFLDVEARAKSFSSLAAYGGDGRTLTNVGDPVRLTNIQVTSGYFDVTATPPLLGRTLNRADNEPGHTHVIVLSYKLWQSRFGGDPNVTSRSATIDGEAWQIVGVMPKGYEWPIGADSWTPSTYNDSFLHTNRGAWFLEAFGRLKPGVTIDQAATEMADLGRQLEREYPDMNAHVGMTAFPIVDDLLGDTKRAILVLFGAVGFVLLIACVNVANLALARAASRDAEVAVRVALGAGRWQLVRQGLIESLLLAGIGGAAGLGLAVLGLRALHSVAPPGVPRLDAVALDWTAVAFTFAVTTIAALLFGILPAFHTSRHSVSDALRERGRSALGGPRARLTRHGLVVAEMALAVLLLTGAGLLIRSFVRLMHVDPGFRVDHGLVFRVGLPGQRYPDDPARVAFFDRATTSLAAAPGVAGVGVVFFVPPTPPTFNLSFEISGRPPVKPADQPTMEIRIADPAYFGLMGIQIRRGRGFAATDRAGTTPVALITESGAREFFAGEDPIGKHVSIGWRRDKQAVGGDIVGIAADVKSFGIDKDAPPQLYLPLAQTPESSMAFVVRTTVDPESMFGTVRASMRQVDPNLPLARLETLTEHVDKSVAERRFYMLLLGLFAAVAMALAAVGIFGVLSYLVAQRTREIGIRMALGADRPTVMRLVLRQTFALAGGGAIIGSLAGLGLTGLMQTMLFDIRPTDPATFAVVDAGLLLIATLAAWVPTRRAALVDPTEALRGE